MRPAPISSARVATPMMPRAPTDLADQPTDLFEQRRHVQGAQQEHHRIHPRHPVGGTSSRNVLGGRTTTFPGVNDGGVDEFLGWPLTSVSISPAGLILRRVQPA